MAGDWFKVEVTKPNKLEISEIAYTLGVSKHEALGMFTEYLSWLNQHCEDGTLPLSSIKFIDNMTDNIGFCDALASVGWMVIHDNYLEIAKYDRHNGENAKKRAETNRRVAKSRAIKQLENDHLKPAHDSDVTEKALHMRIPEKRREEKNREEKSSPVLEEQEGLKNVDMESDIKH